MPLPEWMTPHGPRCQNCGGTKKEHVRRAPYRCYKLTEGYYLPWSEADWEAAKAAAAGQPPALRVRFPYSPHDLAVDTSNSNAIVEIISYPFLDAGEAAIMARLTIGDPTSLTQLRCSGLQPFPGSRDRMQGYREGFQHGWACAAAAARALGSKSQEGK